MRREERREKREGSDEDGGPLHPPILEDFRWWRSDGTDDRYFSTVRVGPAAQRKPLYLFSPLSSPRQVMASGNPGTWAPGSACGGRTGGAAMGWARGLPGEVMEGN